MYLLHTYISTLFSCMYCHNIIFLLILLINLPEMLKLNFHHTYVMSRSVQLMTVTIVIVSQTLNDFVTLSISVDVKIISLGL